MTLCDRHALLGPRCDLQKGHDGKHVHTYENGRGFDWTDEGQARLAADWERKGGGWD